MIKKAAAILFSLILFQVQAFALVGGPWGSSSTNIYGTYSAVLFPDGGEADDLLDESLALNSLGLFAMVVTPEGFSEGYCVLFAEGAALVGPVIGLGDPDRGTITGLLETRINLITDGIFGPIEYLGTGSGAFQASLVTGESDSIFGGSASQRIEGTADLVVSLGSIGDGTAISYIVDGYKSSANTSDPIVAPNFGNLSGTGD